MWSGKHFIHKILAVSITTVIITIFDWFQDTFRYHMPFNKHCQWRKHQHFVVHYPHSRQWSLCGKAWKQSYLPTSLSLKHTLTNLKITMSKPLYHQRTSLQWLTSHIDIFMTYQIILKSSHKSFYEARVDLQKCPWRVRVSRNTLHWEGKRHLWDYLRCHANTQSSSSRSIHQELSMHLLTLPEGHLTLTLMTTLMATVTNLMTSSRQLPSSG